MNRFILLTAFLFSCAVIQAQKVYFVYIQSDPAEPFYLRINEKIVSSSSGGYLILPKLADTTYQFTIGFPRNKFPESAFTITIARKDRGYLLKNFGDKGWGLYDLQTLEVQMGNRKGETAASSGNGFTDMLSKAAGDPSLREQPAKPPVAEEPAKKPAEQKPADMKPAVVEEKKPVVAEVKPVAEEKKPVTEEKKPAADEQKPAIEAVAEKAVTVTPVTTSKDTISTITAPVEKPAVEPVQQSESPAFPQKDIAPAEYKMTTVKKRSESSTTEGFGLVYLDTWADGSVDTVRLLIPNPKQVFTAPAKEEPKEEKKMLEIPVSSSLPPDTVAAVQQPAARDTMVTEKAPVITAPVANAVSDAVKKPCGQVADENDFLQLRRQMVAAENEEDMVDVAKKYFRLKCFSVAQVKSLGALLLKDEGRYNFFDAVYRYTTDPEQFPSLQSELKEEYYINRFRAMLRN